MTLDSCRHVDRLPFREADNGLLVVAAAAAATPEHLHLALLPQRVDRHHLDLEQVLDRDLDFRLGGVERPLEGDLVMLRAQRRLLGAHRRQSSEEHTSELQSLMRIPYAVFCLKKNRTEQTDYNRQTPTNL